MQFGCQPGPGGSQRRPGNVYFYRLCRGTRGSEGRGGDLVWRGLAAPLFKGNVQGQQRLVSMQPQELAAGGVWGALCNQAGADASPHGADIVPQSLHPAWASLQPVEKTGMKRINPWELHVGCPAQHPLSCTGVLPKDSGCGGSVPLPTQQHPPTPKASFLTIWERISPERNISQDTIIFLATDISVIQRGSRIFKAGMLSSCVGNISATPSPAFPAGFIILQLYSFIPLSLPGCSYTVQQA